MSDSRGRNVGAHWEKGDHRGADLSPTTVDPRPPGHRVISATGHGVATGRSRLKPTPRMGGIALKNGLVLVSDGYWAAAIRETDNSISVASGRKKRLPSQRSLRRGPRASRRPAAAGGLKTPDLQGLPMIRGLARFAEILLVVAQVKLRMPQAELPLEGGRMAAVLATAYAATSTVRAVGPQSRIVKETGAALAAFVPAVLSLKNSSISGYHGAEHKVIGGWESEMRGQGAVKGPGGVPGERPFASDTRSAPKEHDRCGSNLVGPLLFTTIAANALIRGKSGGISPISSVVAGAAGLGAALEALRWATSHGDSLAARVLMLPGRIIQKTFTTSEPTAQQLEVAARAMKELLRLEAAGV